MSKNNAQLHRKIVPEMVELLEERYDILRHIQYAEPIGRRALALMMDKGERTVRAQVKFLKDAGLIEFSAIGMMLTPEGYAIKNELADYVKGLYGLTMLEAELSEKLGIDKVLIIPGDTEANHMVCRELGRATAGILSKYLDNTNMVVAVSGGTMMANVAEAVDFSQPTVTVVPARGGLGEQVEYQANTIAATMANKLGGKYRMLHIPDGISEEAINSMLVDSRSILNVADMIKTANVLIHGIGQADRMAIRRGYDETFVTELRESGAVGEALGNYCALTGNVVYKTNGIGLQLNDLADIGLVIAVAGGQQKAEAIVAVTQAGGQDVLITDESAARAIQSII